MSFSLLNYAPWKLLLLDILCTPWWNLCSWNLPGCVGRFLIRFMAARAESGAETSSSSTFKYSKSIRSLKRCCVREEPCGAVERRADGEKSCKIRCIYMCAQPYVLEFYKKFWIIWRNLCFSCPQARCWWGVYLSSCSFRSPAAGNAIYLDIPEPGLQSMFASG